MKIKSKSKNSFSKRFKSTSSGKLKRGRAYTSHHFKARSAKQKRCLRKASLLDKSDFKRIRKVFNCKSI